MSCIYCASLQSCPPNALCMVCTGVPTSVPSQISAHANHTPTSQQGADSCGYKLRQRRTRLQDAGFSEDIPHLAAVDAHRCDVNQPNTCGCTWCCPHALHSVVRTIWHTQLILACIMWRVFNFAKLWEYMRLFEQA
jgi:hypothetical protein